MDALLTKAVECLRDAHSRSTTGRWIKGKTTHHTVVQGSGYHIAEFHHADDANFVDQAHDFVPVVLDALLAAHKEINELKAALNAVGGM